MRGSRGLARNIVIALLFAVGIAGVVFFKQQYDREREQDTLVGDASTAHDASIDHHAAAAKAKPKPGGKKTVRGGKTHVVGRSGAGGAAHTAANNGAHHVAPGHSAPNAVTAPSHHGAHAHGPSYESVLDSNNQQITMGANSGPDLTDAQLSGPMSDGSFVSDCGAPDDMSVTVKVAIKNGRAVGVSVATHPHSPEVVGCVDRHVRGLSWPHSAKLDSFVTTY